MSPSPTTHAPAAFTCDCGRRGRAACAGLPFYKERHGKRYCLLHYPGREKSVAFGELLKKRRAEENFDFTGVWFPDDVDFQRFIFNKPAKFTFATFNSGANFQFAVFKSEAYFGCATFHGLTNFHQVNFCAGTSFYSTTFGAAPGAATNFIYAVFKAQAAFDFSTFMTRVDFAFATFDSEANFIHATFDAKASFLYANFKGYARFNGGKENKVFDGDDAALSLRFARVENPDHLSFQNLALRPGWFVNVDARRFEFINADWNWGDISVEREIKSIGGEDVLSAHRLLAIACRNLAVNAEENHRYEEASRFRYTAMEARRLERRRGLTPWHLSWWYWLASGYGERVWRAFVVLLSLLALFALLCVWLDFPNWGHAAPAVSVAPAIGVEWLLQRLSRLPGAFLYSLGVMALQKPEPRPDTDAAQAVVMLATILGPVQAALLALAIRRKFMR